MTAISKLLAASVLATFTAIGHTQKPALTQNMDEQGRVPYHSSSVTKNCNVSCPLFFKGVPAGYRLVITYYSVDFSADTKGNPATAILTGGTAAPGDTGFYQIYLPTPLSADESLYVFSGPVTYYVEALNVPRINLGAVIIGATVEGAINGYLVNLNQ